MRSHGLRPYIQGLFTYALHEVTTSSIMRSLLHGGWSLSDRSTCSAPPWRGSGVSLEEQGRSAVQPGGYEQRERR